MQLQIVHLLLALQSVFAWQASKRFLSYQRIFSPKLSLKMEDRINFISSLNGDRGSFFKAITSTLNIEGKVALIDSCSTSLEAYKDLTGTSFYFIFEAEPNFNEEISKNTDFTIFIPNNESSQPDLLATTKRFENLYQTLQNPLQNPTIGNWSNFLSLTFPRVEEVLPIHQDLRVGIDALELRVDLLEDISPLSIHRQISFLKKTFNLPIVYTVRTLSQIGKYPDEDVSGVFRLLLEGFKAGVEWIDIEGSLPEGTIRELAGIRRDKYGKTAKLLGSLHITTVPEEGEVEKMYEKCDLFGEADVLKVVTGAKSKKDCENVHIIGRKQKKPYIGLCLGEDGSYSRVLNKLYTPVTHELMAAAAPGQLTAKQLKIRRLENGLIKSKKYFLFGTPIQQSLSPLMHNNGFNTLLIPSEYYLKEESEVDKYLPMLKDGLDWFGGASVTIPHKETIIPLLDEVRGAAAEIGAVNTIIVEDFNDPVGIALGECTLDEREKTKRTVGLNTDWLGIYRPIYKLLQRQGSSERSEDRVGLVIGAGGTARAASYAVKELGFKLVVANRDFSKAQKVTERMGGTAIALSELENLTNSGNLLNPKKIQVIISTLPAAANFTLPEIFFDDKEKPTVLLDVVYKPVNTALIQQALKHNWSVVQGATMLLEQGLEQFRLWTGRIPPREQMELAIFKDIQKIDSL